MKKLLTTLAVALVTASTHAAAISWSVDFSELGGAYEGYIAYLVTADQLAALTTDGLLDEDKWGGATLANMTLDKKGGNIMNVGDYSPGDTVTVYTILFKGPSVTAGVTEYMISTVSITDTFGTTGGISAGFVRGDNMPIVFETQWEVIPEPATMALLGIGIVAVGLRRRRK